MKKLRLKTQIPNRILKGNLWIFSNELDTLPNAEPGEIVELIDKQNNSLGLGFYNPKSQIAIRLLCCPSQTDFRSLLKDRIQAAKEYREKIFPNEQCYRLVYSESDLLPGLIIDKYDNYFVLQINSAGLEKFIPNIVEILKELFPRTEGILAKNISSFRKQEGLELYTKTIFGQIPESIIVTENNIKYKINLFEAQKTGLFLDHKLNRRFVGRLAKNLSVLDCFSNYGGFGLNCALWKAKSITCVDISEKACASAKENFQLNNFSNFAVVIADAMDFLKKAYRNNQKWDLVILDPPSFTKTKKNVKNAIAGYSSLNKYALRVLNSEGYLATASCSMYVDENQFLKIIENVAFGQRIRLIQIFRGGQAPDHPVIPSMPETRYLKFFVFRVQKQ